MTKIVLWPDVQREDGHWLPAVSLAQSLTAAGHTVTAIGIPDTQAIATEYGITFNTVLAQYFPFGWAVERLEKPKPQLSHLMPLARGELDAIFPATSAGPDLLIAGYFAALEALIVYWRRRKQGRKIRLVTLTTFMRHPDQTPALFAKGTLLSLPSTVSQKLMVEASGEANITIDEFVAPLDLLNDATWGTTYEIIPVHEDFEFKERDWDHPKLRVKYVEPMVLRNRVGGDPPPPGELEVIGKYPATGDLLYGACGSQVEVFETSARQFYINLIEMMNEPGLTSDTSLPLLLSVGRKLYQEFKKLYSEGGTDGTRRLPKKVCIAPWVPQRQILTRAKAAFLHGGLATIKESIYAGVPMIVTPMVNDQFDNALRIERSEVGVMVQLERLSPENLRAALTEVQSGPWFKRATAALQTKFTAKEDVAAAAKDSVALISSIPIP